jgi:hypothetical protein
MSKIKFNSKNTLKISSVISLLNDCLGNGYSKFEFDVQNAHFISSNQPNRDADCSFQCDTDIKVENNNLSDLIEALKLNNNKFLLTNQPCHLIVGFL